MKTYLLLVKLVNAFGGRFQFGEVAIPLFQQWDCQPPVICDTYLAW